MKKALLVRPHDFIVDSMRAWLKSLPLEPVRFRALAELAGHEPAMVACAVVSTAISSEVKSTVREAVVEVRRTLPGVPLLVTGLSRFASARATLEGDLEGLGLSLHAVGDAVPRAGTPVVYICADDLKPGRVDRLTALARERFGLV